MFTANVGAVLVLIFTVHGTQSTCDEKYASLTPTHTMCRTDHPDAVATTLTQEVKNQIVDMHNEIRVNVSDAADMMKTKWDERLAAVAEKWVMQCTGGHDANRREPDLPGFVGQNVAAGGGSFSFAGAVTLWASEITDFQYGQWTSTTGHYIQQIFAKTRLIGCGQAQCGQKRRFACNYYSGTVGSTPYTKGSSCGQCPDSCDDGGLCDCTSGPGACQNGGTYDVNTCSCSCSALWSGDVTCSTMSCPDDDFQKWCSYIDPGVYCSMEDFADFIQATCPILCGLCPANRS